MIQTDDYYPFGMVASSTSSQGGGVRENNYLYQGQELQDDLDLGWYQFKWRMHDPALGRFMVIDPLSEDYYYNSTYAFSENKVTAHIELEGLESWYAADGNIIANGPLRDEARASAHINYLNKKKMGFSFTNELGHQRNKSAWVSQNMLVRPDEACWRATDLIMSYANIDGGFRGKNDSNIIQTAKEIKGKLEITESAKEGLAYLEEHIINGELVTVGLNHTLGQTINEGTTDHFVSVDGRGYDTETGQYFFSYNEVNSDNPEEAKSSQNRLYVQEDGSLTGINQYGKEITVSQVRMNHGRRREDVRIYSAPQ